MLRQENDLHSTDDELSWMSWVWLEMVEENRPRDRRDDDQLS